MKIVGPYTSPTIYSEHPGIVELTSSDPSVASVDASVVIPGTRTYGNMGGGGDYLAKATAAANGRTSTTILIELNIDKTIAMSQGAANGSMSVIPVMSSMRADIGRRVNWCLFLRGNGLGKYHLGYMQSANNASEPAVYVGTSTLGYNLPAGTVRFACALNDGTADAASVLVYGASRASAFAFNRGVTTGTMGGTEAIVWQSGVSCSKIARIVSNDELDAWFADGTIPATDREFVFAGGHEIVSDAPVIWDSSANACDLTATQINNWQAPGMSADYTDDPGNPVTPFQPFTITPNSTGTFTITARRRRQGVPDRATDEEKYETTSETFTITEMPAEVVQYVRLLITTSTPGTVDIASSDPSVVTFPSSIVVGPTLQYEVLGTVVGAGTSTITTSMGGAVLGTTTVTIEDTPTVIEAGPNQDVRTKLL